MYSLLDHHHSLISPLPGSVVKQVLKLLEVLDGHSFTTSKSFSPLSILYAKIFDAQKHAEVSTAYQHFTFCVIFHNLLFFQYQVSLSADSLCMLLCQWAVTSHRHGEHRPLAVARILRQLQTDLPPVSVIIATCTVHVHFNPLG